MLLHSHRTNIHNNSRGQDSQDNAVPAASAPAKTPSPKMSYVLIDSELFVSTLGFIHVRAHKRFSRCFQDPKPR